MHPAQSVPLKRVFIGHGRSLIWRPLKDFLVERLHLEYEEFNRESTAGISTTDRLQAMLQNACFALLVMTAEDHYADGSQHARENVIHEIGLFQGRLGFERAIVLIEEGCAEFSNIHGLTQLCFPRGNIIAVSEDIRRVMEREGLVATDLLPESSSQSQAKVNLPGITNTSVSTGDVIGSRMRIHVGHDLKETI